MFKIFDFFCDQCHHKEMDQMIKDGEKITCPGCGHNMTKLFPMPQASEQRGHFSPFYSDTFGFHVTDRKDLKKLKELRVKHNLECVGHSMGFPVDRKAVANNYRNDGLTESVLKKGD